MKKVKGYFFTVLLLGLETQLISVFASTVVSDKLNFILFDRGSNRIYK